MEDIMKIVQFFEKFVLLTKGVIKRNQNGKNDKNMNSITYH